MPAVLERQEHEPTAAQAPFRPYGGALDAWFDDSSRVILLEGPAGTGKSRMWFERAHYLLSTYPGARGLYVRVTRESCTDSGLVTFEEHVLPEGHPFLDGAGRGNRHSYQYPNGSELVVGGLDKPTRLYSTEFDFIFVQEASETSEAQVQPFLRALRNHAIPLEGAGEDGEPRFLAQIWMDTNPTYEEHWLYEWEAEGRLTTYKSHHADNPTVSADYLAGLSLLRGSDYDSLYLGKRVGIVAGSYYGELLQQARADGRIRRGVYDPRYAVNVAVDHGLDDYTSLWFFQVSPWADWRFVAYFEFAGEPSSYYCSVIDDWCRDGRWTLGRIFLPHDSEARQDAGDRVSRRADTYREHFGAERVKRVPRVADKSEHIEACRNLLHHALFDEERCKDGIGRLKQYRRDLNIKTGVYGRPVHDQSSHAADALAYAITGYQPPSAAKPAPEWKRERKTSRW